MHSQHSPGTLGNKMEVTIQFHGWREVAIVQ